jgi:hypothetical protein
MLGNLQYLTASENSLLSMRNKDIITIDEKLINFNENWIDSDLQDMRDVDINKLIKRKEIPIKSLLKDSEKKDTEQGLHRQSSMEISDSGKSESVLIMNFIEDTIKHLKKMEPNEKALKDFIRIFTYHVNHNKSIKFDKEDKLIIDYLVENYSEGFYNIARFWLYQEYLTNTDSRRYDTILLKLLSKLEGNRAKFELERLKDEWVMFIQDLPRYTDKCLEHIFDILKELIELFRKEGGKKNATIDKVYSVLKNIYFKIKHLSQDIKVSYDLSEQILRKYFEILRLNDAQLTSLTIKFIYEHFYSHEQEKIREFAKNQFLELKNYQKDINENVVKCKYSLFFFLCSKGDQELILTLPEVYAESNQIIKTILDKRLDVILKHMNANEAGKLVTRCSPECLKIVLEIIEKMKLGDVNNNKLISKIKKFYENEEKNHQILIALADKLMISGFFTSFLWDKIKKLDNYPNFGEVIPKVFGKLNNNDKNEFIYDNIYFKTSLGATDKVVLYILYYFYFSQNLERANLPQNYQGVNFSYDISILIKYYKQLKSDKYSENISILLDKIIEQIPNDYITMDNLYVTLSYQLYEAFKDDSGLKKLILGIISI